MFKIHLLGRLLVVAIIVASGKVLACDGDYGLPLGSFEGIVAYSNGDAQSCTGTGNGTYQCVEYVRRFYEYEVENTLGYLEGTPDDPPSDPVDDGWAVWAFTDWPANSGLTAYTNGVSTTPPAPGDIYCQSGHTYGHVAIIKSVNLSTMQVTIIDQNRSTSDAELPRTLSVDGQGRYSIQSVGTGYTTQGWLRDLDYTPTPTFLATMTEASISPNGPYYPGQPITCTMKWRNDGSATWHNTTGSGKNYVELASCNSSGTITASYLYASGLTPAWFSNLVPCTFTPATVGPGATATFTFQGKIPLSAQPGQVPVYFGPVYNSQIMQGWNGNGFTITVIAPEPELTGEAFTAFSGYFNLDNKVDVGLWEHSTGDVYVALRDPTSNRFVFDEDPWLEGFGDPTVDQLLVGDYSGDGYHDLCGYRASSGSWYVALNQYGSTGGFVSDGCWLSGWASGGIGGSGDWIPLTADHSGDGYDDLCVFKPSLGRWVVAYNWGDYFAQATGVWLDDWGDGDYGTYWPFVGTLNYGAKEDIGCYHPGTGKWFVATSNSPTPSFTSQGEWLSGWASGSSTTWKYFTGKCTNDAYDDLIVYKPSDGKWVVAKNYQTYFSQLDGAASGGAWLYPWAVEDGDEWQALVGDVSGDGWTDLIVYSPVDGKWAVAFNNGGYNPPYFEQANGTYDGAWLMGWGVESGGSGKATADHATSLPKQYALFQNYPNPFNPVTNISYSLPQATHVTLEVFNILGQRVALLVNHDLPAGNHTTVWQADKQASGIYFYRLRTEDAVETKKMLLLK